ncbi:hypothetical protein ACFC4G_44160 [Streptomyces sp. NPDC056002]|uniref:hypothetical protein n=1 Tax=Streptomyces sp. NPDC056002 TaxID=3345675 RepID=UPI0035DD51C0
MQSALDLADRLVKTNANSQRSHYIFQPAIGSFYEGAQYSHKELVSARDPWCLVTVVDDDGREVLLVRGGEGHVAGRPVRAVPGLGGACRRRRRPCRTLP